MENLIIKNFPLPPPNKHDTLSDFPPKPIKNSIFFPKYQTTDTQLNHLCKTGRLEEAVSTLPSLSRNGSTLNPKTLLNLLQSCIDSNSLTLGRKVHAQMHLVEDKSPFLDTKLVSMYAKCGSLRDARKVFDEMRERNLYTWSAIIGGYVREQRWKEVVGLFHGMVREGCLPDWFLLPKILQACGNCRDLETGKVIHCLAVKCGVGGYPFVSNSILSVYAKCGDLRSAKRCFEGIDRGNRVAWNSLISGYCQIGEIDEAQRLFDVMCDEGIEPCLVTWNILIAGYNQIRCCDVAMGLMKKMESYGVVPDVVTWTSMISGLTQNGKTIEASNMFCEMILAGIEPNGVTIASVISACASSKFLHKGLQSHSVAIKMGCLGDMLICNALIDMYSKCGELESAWKVFDMMQEKDVWSWNSMIGGYCQAGYCGKAYELFMKMRESETQPDAITWNNMISGYIQHGDEDRAMDMFWRMEKDGEIKKDAASWNSLISGYLQIEQKDKAFSIFRQMQFSSFRPSSVTILSVLPACASLLALKKVKEIHACVIRRNLESVLPITNSLIDTYAKSGKLDYSRTIFDRTFLKDFITWNSLIAGYVLLGQSDVALDLVNQMRELGFKPNRSTFVSIILAYGFAGMIDEGERAFYSMTEDYCIVPCLEHYSAMIVLYGRSGKLKEAMRFIDDMPVDPDFSIWSALLTACFIHGDFALAIHAGENLLDLEPENFLVHRLLFQAYKLCGRAEDSLKVKRLEKDNNVENLVGHSWIEVKNVVHSFASGDSSKSYSDLLDWVGCVSKEMKAYDLQDGFHVEEEEKEEIIGIHSEKLALAFAFACASSPPRTIRIVKNLRMSRDCHNMAKYISMKYGCEIYLSDSNCFHHFKAGHCSCRNYW
ncbi:Pentatricopeptide repeat (PPR-like) superfamily protein [Euphorbia peplus]|nr:Pentatricopeptide repeat (PPR-like) superfamily protein [Euphorbia peplus]WCJ35252.1 Pentatricopeptide repeat (PPR-like) superfamily protein [Euphorbia peplus]